MNITITNNTLTATINTLGAELNSLQDTAGNEYIWEGDPKYWGKHSPVLFPIVGTLKNNSYLYNGDVYALTRHGFARDKEFTVSNETGNSATFTVAATDDTLRVYPFDFELTIIYTLTENNLEITYTVTNKGDNKMLFSIGAHPAFALTGNFTDYSLKFEKHETLTANLLENGLVSDKTMPLPQENAILPLAYSLFENDALIFKKLESNQITIQKQGNDMVKVSFDDFPHLGIWTVKDAPFVCIEPWQGYADNAKTDSIFSKKEGIKTLDPGEVYKAGFSIETLIK
ncbi:aldose 1-epimerase family protein [Flavobacterium rhizosphaerae]|uniref:Aldose 1-epimerase family protein n=1 Tax=Flavobacterium rhizosphaerae TaxID=3163298 RepID=A0ABW8YUF9_9FLAO